MRVVIVLPLKLRVNLRVAMGELVWVEISARPLTISDNPTLVTLIRHLHLESIGYASSRGILASIV